MAEGLSVREFWERVRGAGHRGLLLSWFNDDELCSAVAADLTEETLCAEDFTDNWLHTAFGRNPAPSWKDFMELLEDRCIPRTRAGLREYLEALGLDAYDPLQIIRKTGGRMAEDHQWIRIEEEL